MADNQDSGQGGNFIRRGWNVLKKPTASFSLGTLLVGGFVAGIIFWGGFNTAMEATNNEDFCISCHEMKDNVYKEYRDTIHYNNRTGVRATCPDCHVPKEWTHKMVRKIQASNELLAQSAGQHRYPGEVRSQAADVGASRLGLDEAHRFARMPQLPRL